MSGLGIAALAAVSAWLTVLSVAVMLVTRQLGLVTVRLSMLAPHTPADDDGLELDAEVPREALDLIGRDEEQTVVLLLSATCGTCRGLASRLSERELDDRTTVLVAGRHVLAEGIAELLPEGVDRRLDPEASQIGRLLELESVPFGLRIEGGVVSMKAYLHDPADVLKLTRGVGATRSSAAERPSDDSHPLPVARHGHVPLNEEEKEVAR